MNNKLHVNKIKIFVLIISPLIVALICLGVGRYNIGILETFNILFSPLTNTMVSGTDFMVIYNIRIPRIILSLSVGLGLAVSGAAFQSMFSNPLATPDTLGVASGASFGAALALLFNWNLIGVQFLALIFGLLALLITLWISKNSTSQSKVVMIVLSGLVVSALFKALVSAIKYIADPNDTLPAITYWLMGSMNGANYRTLLFGLPLIIIGVLIIYFLRWRLNIISLSEDEANSLGGHVHLVRLLLMGSATVVTASCISMCGAVGWVGLLIPHVSRIVLGSNNKKVIPASMSLGASFLMIVDTLARSMSASEIPLSILTALIGAPFFIVLLKRIGGARL
ncbi:MAG: FecCD family ABC transporter permease [Pleomorphochaeta sp.]|nr:iron ABC transporter permease [Sphaerochaetaceae bacterium]